MNQLAACEGALAAALEKLHEVAAERDRLRDGIEALAKEIDATGEGGWWWARKFRALLAGSAEPA